jgi:hypothetical protein
MIISTDIHSSGNVELDPQVRCRAKADPSFGLWNH